jgi:hypothetical protein
MTRLGISTKRRSCVGKIRHRSKEAANQHMQHLIDGGASEARLKVYGPCKHCGGGFHVGHLGRRAATA